MILLILILYISTSKQTSHKCITISNTICGTKLQVVSNTFPNSSIFNSTILNLINGQDSQKLLSNYSGCSPPDVRYSKSFWCFFLKTDQSDKCQVFQSEVKLCSSTCDAMIESLNKSFIDKGKCSQSDKYKKRRDNVSKTLVEFCKTSTLKSDCVVSVPDETNNCGFSQIIDTKEYCKSENDNCCSDFLFKEEIMESITPEPICEIIDFNCWDPLKIGIAAGLVVLTLGALTIYFAISRKKKDGMDISIPVPSHDHDYTTLVKHVTEPVNHAWYDSLSDDTPLSTDSSVSPYSRDSSLSTDTSFLNAQTDDRDKKSVSDLFDRGYKIYVANDDYFPNDSSRLTVHRGDQVVIKEVLSDEFGVGVNLNTTDEGVILMSRLNGL